MPVLLEFLYFRASQYWTRTLDNINHAVWNLL